ncbi:MAG: hydrolase [Armatimonadetes bacterium]|nr:hydrolase [Armatimonadota bacterium]
MRHPDLAQREKSCLLVVDVQERLMPAIHGGERVVESCVRLIRGVRLLQVPILVTTQYVRGLGPLVAPVAEALGESGAFDKTAFSCCAEDGFFGRLDALEKDTVIVCGVEAHVCVLQTALDLVENGYRVHVVADAIGSRDPENRRVALEKMARAGAVISTTEMVLFELLRRAGAAEFKAVQALVK